MASEQLIEYEDWRDVKKADWTWPNFSPMEMACRGSGAIRVSVDFMKRLSQIRTHLGQPMHLTSACRTTIHNDHINGAPRSFHICDDDLGRGQRGCLAVDVAATEGYYRGMLFSIAWAQGFSVGWNAKRGFLHLDRRIDVGWRQTTFDY